MKKVQLWSVQRDDSGNLAAYDVPSIKNTETEEQLEDIFVRSPDALMEGLTLIGRQVQTEGGPLDLIGVDQDGRLVVFELKRETLTREAVAQVLDYTSDLKRFDDERFARLIEGSSGQRGIREFEDFAGWYFEEFPDKESVLEDSPKMVLVGLGIDPRALRIVDFLAESGIDISLLSFNAFEQGDSLFLARQVESVSPKPTKAGYKSQSKEANIQALRTNATEYEVLDFIEDVSEFIEQKIPEKTYRWPGAWGFTFYLSGFTKEGRPTQHTHVNVSVDWKEKGVLSLYFHERSVQAIGDDMDLLKNILEHSTNKHRSLELKLSRDKWADVKAPLEKVLDKMVRERQNNTSD